jgi:hypothetical protein
MFECSIGEMYESEHDVDEFDLQMDETLKIRVVILEVGIDWMLLDTPSTRPYVWYYCNTNGGSIWIEGDKDGPTYKHIVRFPPNLKLKKLVDK